MALRDMASSGKDKGELHDTLLKTPTSQQVPGIHSTPSRKGVASDARHRCDTRVTVSGNAGLIDEVPKSTQNVPFIAMLEVTIMKKRVVEGSEDLDEEGVQCYGAIELQALIKASVDFCNSGKLKKSVATMLTCASEGDRHLPLAIGLNSVLLDFQEKDIGTLGKPDEKETVIYAVNKPNIIKSTAVSELTGGTNTKLDVCLFKFDSFHQIVAKDIPNAGLHHIMNMVDDAHEDKLLNKVIRKGEVKAHWSDIVSCIELFQRTGTKPFMARDLMMHCDGNLKRTRRHDLESFIWFFAWVCEGKNSEERWTWNGAMIDAMGQKLKYFQYGFKNPENPPKTIREDNRCLWAPLCNVAIDWAWNEMSETRFRKDLPLAQFLDSIDSGFVREPDYRTWDWVDFKVRAAT